MRIRAVAAALALAAAMTACGGGEEGGFFRQYEYEEEIYLSLDGSATVYVHASLAALNALRGTAFPIQPNAPLDRERVRAFFETPLTRVEGQVNASRRRNRRFVHVRVEVEDIRRLGAAAPFAWSDYTFERDGNLFAYRQQVGRPAGDAPAGAGWTGDEIVAFRLHVPSRIAFHNSGAEIGRGNILVWEQPLTARLRGSPLRLDARMEPESILYRTLWLFGWSAAAVAATFALIIWRVRRRALMERAA